jgi:FHA domain-containing protein
MALCPNGHDSADPDFCDVCGHQMTAAALPAAPVLAATAPDAAEPCPVCAEPRTGRFCEGCSYDFVSGVGGRSPDPAPDPQPDTGWVAVVWADRTYYESVLAQGDADSAIPFPKNCPKREISLTGDRIQIGRRSRSRGLSPEIDLAGPPEDPGVSHQHAELVFQPEGGWAVRDHGSTNGTTINGGEDPIDPQTTVPLADGDRVHVGAWTTITVRANP